ncbi:MAG TPA: YciI family protein [Segeticoccus sp.]|uniref:YciI family protein n=1 Tax=Segeticoccus sp. TaxID=2706531 RepID=UPI002D7F7B1B|nr:YciI family protein [Segeticoccus sp.]HET8600966.1 YciI family protein [Segeticoccus sp.]
MARYLVLLPGPEEEWAQLSEEELAEGLKGHEEFWRQLTSHGHRVVTASPLTPSREATSMRFEPDGAVTVTEGPFTESAEQIVGFYLLESEDEADLLKICEDLARTGNHLEIRRLESGDH